MKKGYLCELDSGQDNKTSDTVAEVAKTTTGSDLFWHEKENKGKKSTKLCFFTHIKKVRGNRNHTLALPVCRLR